MWKQLLVEVNINSLLSERIRFLWLKCICIDKHMNNSKSNVRDVSVAAISLGQFNSGISGILFDRGCKYSFYQQNILPSAEKPPGKRGRPGFWVLHLILRIVYSTVT